MLYQTLPKSIVLPRAPSLSSISTRRPPRTGRLHFPAPSGRQSVRVLAGPINFIIQIMSTKEEKPASLPKLMTLNRGFKLAEQWVKNMPGDVEEAGETEVEARPARLGLGAKVPRKSHVGPIFDPVERRLHKKFGAGRKKPAGDEDSIPPPKNEADNGDEDDDENLDSRTNSFAKKRAAPPPPTPQTKKKHK